MVRLDAKANGHDNDRDGAGSSMDEGGSDMVSIDFGDEQSSMHIQKYDS